MDARIELRKKLLKKTKEQMNEKFAGKEIHIIKAVRLLSDLDSINNLMSENASEWKLRQPSGEAAEAFTQLTENTERIASEKKKLMEFIEKEMGEEFPNFSVLATPVLGAKLLASAGSKKRLCFMPASTIQVLGAEKALFAHMRKHAKSPKHGHLFNHPLMQKLPRFKRGRVARIIAGKLCIALKQDYFNGENTSTKTLKELEKQIEKIASEPVTQKQEQREKELIAQHEENKEGTKPTSEKRDSQKSRTWSPEERRAYFAEKNKTTGMGAGQRQTPFKRNEGNTWQKPHHEGRHFGGGFTPRENKSDRPSFGRNENKNKNFGKGRFNKPKHTQKRY